MPLIAGGKKVSTKEKRWCKDVGLGFKTPAEAINGTYIGMFDIVSSVYLFSFDELTLNQTRSALSLVMYPSGDVF